MDQQNTITANSADRVTENAMSAVYLDADEHGIGDAVVTAWISEGSKFDDVRLVHKASGVNRAVLEILGQEVVDEVPVDGRRVNTHWTYRTHELDTERGNVPRVVSRARGIGIRSKPKRPPIAIPAEADAWARDHAPAEPFVLLFPRSYFRCREWPTAHWIELAWRLHAAGVPTKVLLGSDDEQLHNVPSYYFGIDIKAIAALMRRAAVSVTNDSGPAHLGGTLDVPTLAILGPTNPTVFQNYGPDFRMIRSTRANCVGCHWGIPYRASCDRGCHALSDLQVGEVYNEVVRTLRPDLETDAATGLFVRRGTWGKQDRDVLGEVVHGDCYAMRSSEQWSREAFVVDVGGHIGSFVRHVEALQPRAKIVAVEAVPENADVLKLNCGQCAAGRAHGIHAAVSYRKASLALMSSLVEGGAATGGSVVIDRDDAKPETWTPVYALDDRPLSTITLEQIMREHRAIKIDLLKLDCEGSEFDILTNSPAVREGGVRRIVGEYHGEERFRALMAEQFATGWEVTVCRPGGGSIGYFEMRRQ